MKTKFNGTTPPRVVLFSPIAHEDLHDKNFPDGKENNARLKLYTEAIAEIAKANDVAFVDLFTPTLARYQTAKQPWTINGIHLNEYGDSAVSSIIDVSLFGKPLASYIGPRMAQLRAAVLERNFIWFNRYRTVDGYSIYGGRASLKFDEYDPKTGKKTGKINSNREVAQREMEILDEMTANRDKLIWATAA